MSSAIRFSRSASHGSSSVHSDGFQHLPSSIPSAPSHPPSQRSKATTTNTTTGNATATTSSSSRGRSTSRSASRPSLTEGTASSLPYEYAQPQPPPFPFPFPFPSAAAAAAAAGGDRGVEKATPPASRPHHRHTPLEDTHRVRGGGSAGVSQPPYAPAGYFPFAVPNLPWIPPPIIPGGTGYPLKADAYHSAPHAYGDRLPHAAVAPPSCAAPVREDVEWPRPDQLPLPSTFPMPPRTLPLSHTPFSHPHGNINQNTNNWELFPPPPLPPWWFMAALQQQQQQLPASHAFYAPSGSASSDSRSSSSGSESCASSRTSSPVPSPRHVDEEVHFTPPVQQRAQHQHQQQQQQRTRLSAPVGTVETPTPLPRANNTTAATSSTNRTTSNTTASSSRVNNAAAAAAAAVRRRAVSSSDSTDSTFKVRRPSHGGAAPAVKVEKDEAPHHQQRQQTEEEEEEARRHMQQVVSTAESYLSHIEDLYQRLRHRYEEVLLSPMKAPVHSDDERTTQHITLSPQQPTPTAQNNRDDSSPMSRFTPRATVAAAAAPTRAPSLTHSPAPQRPSMMTTAPSTASQSLRDELAMLESQWLRLEEMKQHGIGAAAADAPSFLSASQLSRSAATTLSARAGSGNGVSSATAGRNGGGVRKDLFSNQSVMELINDRKHLLASAA